MIYFKSRLDDCDEIRGLALQRDKDAAEGRLEKSKVDRKYDFAARIAAHVTIRTMDNGIAKMIDLSDWALVEDGF
ncbi:hypothetical protein FRC07_014876 [Ceratobasidium sp. 392]|nr:hypothetical protein FRC07_014876 [Ceratobasidium sp. 392]